MTATLDDVVKSLQELKEMIAYVNGMTCLTPEEVKNELVSRQTTAKKP